MIHYFVFIVSLPPFCLILHRFKGIIWQETLKVLTTMPTLAESVEHRQMLSHVHSKGRVLQLQTGLKLATGDNCMTIQSLGQDTVKEYFKVFVASFPVHSCFSCPWHMHLQPEQLKSFIPWTEEAAKKKDLHA